MTGETRVPRDGVSGRSRALHEWFLRGLRLAPDGEAVRIAGRGITYRRLHEQALGLAGGLLAGGRRPRRVGLLAARSEQAYAGMLAALYAGAAVVPLSPRFPAERTRQMAAAAEVDALIVDARGARTGPVLADELGRIPVVYEPAAVSLAQPLVPAPDDIAYILFTSGSTGRPKGVPVLHRNVDAYLHVVCDRYRFTPQDVFSQTFDLTFDLAIFDLFAGWGSGGTVVCVPPAALAKLPEVIATNGITVWFSAPSVISLVRRLHGLAHADLPTLRWSLFCGEPLLASDAAVWQAAAPRSTVENLYGPTELTISCSVHRWDPATSPDRCVNDIVPIGRVHPGMRYRLEETGELCITGDQMFPGYLDPADDASRFLDADGQRWYRTGDLARRIDGDELAYLGRADSQVKIRGVRVELAEIEWALRRVTGVTDAAAVEADGELVVFCLGERRSAVQVAAEVADILPQQLVPRYVVHVDEFPLNANRKIDRKELKARAVNHVGAARPRTAPVPGRAFVPGPAQGAAPEDIPGVASADGPASPRMPTS
ncbi:AMP-binding protein [Micromonospora sp. NPDC050686]|uniref:AMP-binding protein n=1 Tax=Micromonospora sp. NPDC050686 TaxID=3154631 RepID=UPI0033FBCBB8